MSLIEPCFSLRINVMLKEEHFKNVAKEWFRLAKGEAVTSSEVSGKYFTFLAAWAAFNALYDSEYHYKDCEREKIHEYANHIVTGVRHNRLRTCDPEYRNAVNALKDGGVMNSREGMRCTIQNSSALLDVVNCVYQVRCNLFHGSKKPMDDRDQVLVAAATTIVLEWVSCALSPIEATRQKLEARGGRTHITVG